MKIKLPLLRFISSCLLCVVMIGASAHPDPYLDFFNVKQGTKEANSGCRLILCLAGGPQGANCKKDIKAMYWEIAMAWKGHGWIPMCMGAPGMNVGSMGASNGSLDISASVIEADKKNAGQRNGMSFENEYVTVWRRMPCGFDCDDRYALVYMAVRTPIFSPIDGVTDFKNPAKTWVSTMKNGVFFGGYYAQSPTSGHVAVSGRGMPTSSQFGFSGSKGNSILISNTLAEFDGASPSLNDINYREVTSVPLDVYSAKNFSGETKQRFEDSVVVGASLMGKMTNQIILSTPPVDSPFQRGDIVVASRFNGRYTGDAKDYGLSETYSCKLDPKNPTIDPLCTGVNRGKTMGLSGLRESVVPTDPASYNPNANWVSEESGVGARAMSLSGDSAQYPPHTRESARANSEIQSSHQSLGNAADAVINNAGGIGGDFNVVPDIPDPVDFVGQ